MKIYKSFNALYNSMCRQTVQSMVSDMFKQKEFERTKLNKTPLPVQHRTTKSGEDNPGFCWGRTFYPFSSFKAGSRGSYYVCGDYEDPVFVELVDDGKMVNIYS